MTNRPIPVRVAVDTGGTFTDLYARSSAPHAPESLRAGLALKVPSTPDDPGRAVLDAIAALRRRFAEPLALLEVRHGSTVATNALLEGRAAHVLLLLNEGFEDLLTIGRQSRPELYALQPRAATPAVPRQQIVGVRGRLAADGAEVLPLEDVQGLLDRCHSEFAQAESVAIALLHAWRTPRHEYALRDAIRARWPGLPVVCSHDVAPYVREYERATTTAVQAAVTPRMARYLGALAKTLAPTPLSVQISSGALVPAARAAEQAAQTVLSGPAGGVRGAWLDARRQDDGAVLGLDMGGTSTDVALIEGAPTPRAEGRIGEWPLLLPMLPIETVGAGGGSILWRDDGGALRVGPASAGAFPGPACYGRVPLADARPTLTDAHVVLGRLGATLAADVPADPERARAALLPLASALGCSVADLARAAVQVASATMARACRRVLATSGRDPAELRLCAFGGAGGLHACEVADELGIVEVHVPLAAGVLSARGILDAPRASEATRALMIRAGEAPGRLAAACRAACDEATASLDRDWPESGDAAAARLIVWLDARYQGQDRPLVLAFTPDALCGPDAEQVAATAFVAAHDAAYGHALDRPIEWVALRARASRSAEADPPAAAPHAPGARWSGPCTLPLDGATLFLPTGWDAERSADGAIVARRTGATRQALAEAAVLEVHRQRLEALAEEVGGVLERAALSPNIRERRDFSAAIFDGDGAMLAHAAHIPVHLGSTPLAVAAALASGRLDGDHDVVLNDPFAGGTHNPDITMVRRSASGAFVVANRAHHADVGGLEPGSMPAPIDRQGRWRALRIDDEGYRCGPERCDHARRAEIAAASRTPEERIGDLLAQQAANRVGVGMIARLEASHPGDAASEIAHRNRALLDHGERRMRAVLRSLPDGAYHAEDVLDAALPDGALLRLRVTIEITGHRAIVDLRDAPDACSGPFNAVRAVTLSAVFYAFRLVGGALTGDAEDLPANAGLLRPITVRTRAGSILDAQPPSAVSAGNVETSQRLCDLLLRALSQAAPQVVPAASTGSMNNVLLGHPDGLPGRRWVHYETLGGGGGGGPGGPGADGLHCHMTNTRNTPVEAIEHAFPLRIERYGLAPRPEVRSDEVRGGAGIVRAYRALAPVAVTLLAERRTVPPWGLWGASAGDVGRHTLSRDGGPPQPLQGVANVTLAAGDLLEVVTPSGGAWRPPGDG